MSPPVLTDEERARLLAQEQLKAEIRAEMAKPGKARPESWLGKLLASDNFRWVAGSIAIPLAVWLWGQHAAQEGAASRAAAAKEAEAERKHRYNVETAHRNVDLVIKLLPALNQPQASLERLNALAIMKALEEHGQLSPALGASLHANVERLRGQVAQDGTLNNREARQEVEALAKSAPSSTEIAEMASAAASAAGKPPAPSSTVVVPGTKVYVQIFNEEQRALATQMQAAARELGIAAPGIENVVTAAAKRGKPSPQGYDAPTLLLFKKSDEALAARLAQEVAKRTGTKLTLSDRSSQAAFKNVPAGQLEIWLEDPERRVKR